MCNVQGLQVFFVLIWLRYVGMLLHVDISRRYDALLWILAGAVALRLTLQAAFKRLRAAPKGVAGCDAPACMPTEANKDL